MGLKIEKWSDFNNISLKVKIGRKNYNAILLKKNNSLILRVDILKDIEYWRKQTKNYSLLNGNLSYDNQKITFLDCQCIGQSYNGIVEITSATFDFIIDRIILGKKITKEEYKNINHYEVKYDNIDCFTSTKPYIMNNKSLECKGNMDIYDIMLDNKKISMVFSCSESQNDVSLIIKRNTTVIFNEKKKINISQVLDNIYKFRNFLMIFLKKAIIVKEQYIFINNEKYCVFDCRDGELLTTNSDLEFHLNHRCLKIEKISNISDICQNFFNKYEMLYPIIELYFNVTQFKVPNLTRFVNAVTMLEYFSRTFDFNSALLLTQINNPKRKDPEYKSMVMSLLNNVNCIFNYSNAEIELIAQNIKHSRDKYIHYLNQNSTKTLSYDEQFCYSYFIEDLVLLNVYTILDLEIQKYENLSFEGFYYDKTDLIK